MAAALPWRTAWIVGASSGIGAEIAKLLAAQGVTVAASARSIEKLAALGHGIKPFPLDVTDRDAVAKTYRAVEAELGDLDLALFCAGTYDAEGPGWFDAQAFERTMQVNYVGTINCLAAVWPAFRARRKGHIAWIASVAGYRGLPRAKSYGPTKAALINLAEAMKPEMDAAGVRLSIVNPGFVATPLTAKNDFTMPFLLSPEDAARRSIDGLAKGKFEIVYPWQMTLLMKALRLLPYPLYFTLSRRSLPR
jgi:short-subunit dehydrogenase